MKKIIGFLMAAVLCLSFASCGTNTNPTGQPSATAKTIEVKSVEDLKNLKIGTQADSSALEMMQASPAYASFKNNIKEYKTYDLAILDMKAGRIDVIVVDQVLGEYKATLGEALAVCDYSFGDDYYAIGCRKGEDDVATKLNNALKTLIDNGKAAQISNKWFGKNIVMLEGYTADDKDTPEGAGWAYIKNKGELIIGLDDTFAPMGFRDNQNNLVGFDIDLANAVGELLGIKIKFQPIDWNAKGMELSSKRIDCIWNGMSASEERQRDMSLTKKYLNNKIIVMTLKK